jgi:hypothetical protein
MGNLDGTDPANDPQFVNAADGDLRLQADSPAIDAGSARLLTGDILTDLAGGLRVVDGDADGSPQVDLGAFEHQLAGITINAGVVTVAESGTTNAYRMVLGSRSLADVTITFNEVAPTTDAEPQLCITPTELTFTPDAWNQPQTVRVAAVDDAISEDDHTGTIGYVVSSSDAGYNGFDIADITVAITDNDTPGDPVDPGDPGDPDDPGGSNDLTDLSTIYVPFVTR